MPPPLEPKLKLPPVSTTTASNSSTARTDTLPLSRLHSQYRRDRSSIVDGTTDKATAAFIRRTLCPQQLSNEKDRATPRPLDELLPPLTSSNAVDLQLYALIAIIVREFVYSWYSKITPDHVFVDEVVQLLAHCTRALEQRLRKIDLEALLLDEIPNLLEAHIIAYRISTQKLQPPLTTDARQVYHALHPHPALSPVPIASDLVKAQQGHETAYRQLLVQGSLAVLLPTEDLENGCLRTLVADILAEMILGNGIAGKASQAWMIWEGITKGIESWKGRIHEDKPTTRKSRLQRFGLVPGEPGAGSSSIGSSSKQALSNMFWRFVQYCSVAFLTIRSIILTLIMSTSLPPRSPKNDMVEMGGAERMKFGPGPMVEPPSQRPVIMMKAWSCVGDLLELEARMPWLYGLLSLIQWGALMGPGKVGGTNGAIDKLLSHVISTHLLNVNHLAPLLLTLRRGFFPGNTLGPTRPIPDETEILTIKAHCVRAIMSLAPKTVWSIYLNTTDEQEQRKQIEEVLDIFSDTYCNKHLLYGIVELLFVRLMPEMAEKGPKELLEMRLD